MLLEQRDTVLRPRHEMGTGPRRDVPNCHPRWPQYVGFGGAEV